MDQSAWNAFVKQVRDALKHLHDIKYLRQSPLASLFAVDGRFDTPVVVQEILTKAIECLEPVQSDPDYAQALMAYECLFYQYVQGSNQQEVADQLGISPRQLRREQSAAIDRLACALWREYDLEQARPQESGQNQASSQEQASGSDMRQELAWVKDTSAADPTCLEDVLSDVLELVSSLAQKYGVEVETDVPSGLPCLAVHPVALNQILLGLLSLAIHRSAGHIVCVDARLQRWEIEIQIRCQDRDLDTIESLNQASLEMLYQLAAMCGGRLAVADDGEGFLATLAIPELEQLPVLVIEDNVDTLQLFQRYVSGTRYRLITSPDPGQALTLAEEVCPRVIVLDVMMPQVGGWKVLARFRQHPLTKDTPIIVCTILPQEELALSLGANASVRKPVTRQDFLTALDRQIR